MSNAVADGPREVGSPEWCARLIRATLDDSLALIKEALVMAGDRVEGAPRTVLQQYVQSHEYGEFMGAVVLQSKADMERSIRAIADVVNGIITLFESSGGSVMSSMVLARSAGEIVMRFCHIHDPKLSPARTLLRMAAYQLESIEDNLRTAQAFGIHGEEDARDARQNIAKMQTFLADHGIARLPDPRRPEFSVNVSLEGVTENVKFNATDAYRLYLRVGFWDWALGSGATHGRGWFLPNVVGTFEEEPLMHSHDIAITVTLQILELATATAVAVGGHVGLDTGEYQRRVHQRRIGATAVHREEAGYAVGHKDYGQQ